MKLQGTVQKKKADKEIEMKSILKGQIQLQVNTIFFVDILWQR